jgi:hypothetical protein
VYYLFDKISTLLYRIGVSYYDSSLRQLNVLEAWDDGDKGFSVIDLGMISPLLLLDLSSVLVSTFLLVAIFHHG